MRRPRSSIVCAVAVVLGGTGFAMPAFAQSAAPTSAQATALTAYDKALGAFREVLVERRAQIQAKQALPDRPGQALYLARLQVMSTYKDLTDALPTRIGRPNKFNVPPAYFDADIEPLIDDYRALIALMEAPPADAQASTRPTRTLSTSARRLRAPRASMP